MRTPNKFRADEVDGFATYRDPWEEPELVLGFCRLVIIAGFWVALICLFAYWIPGLIITVLILFAAIFIVCWNFNKVGDQEKFNKEALVHNLKRKYAIDGLIGSNWALEPFQGYEQDIEIAVKGKSYFYKLTQDLSSGEPTLHDIPQDSTENSDVIKVEDLLRK